MPCHAQVEVLRQQSSPFTGAAAAIRLQAAAYSLHHDSSSAAAIADPNAAFSPDAAALPRLSSNALGSRKAASSASAAGTLVRQSTLRAAALLTAASTESHGSGSGQNVHPLTVMRIAACSEDSNAPAVDPTDGPLGEAGRLRMAVAAHGLCVREKLTELLVSPGLDDALVPTSDSPSAAVTLQQFPQPEAPTTAAHTRLPVPKATSPGANSESVAQDASLSHSSAGISGARCPSSCRGGSRSIGGNRGPRDGDVHLHDCQISVPLAGPRQGHSPPSSESAAAANTDNAELGQPALRTGHGRRGTSSVRGVNRGPAQHAAEAAGFTAVPVAGAAGAAPTGPAAAAREVDGTRVRRTRRQPLPATGAATKTAALECTIVYPAMANHTMASGYPPAPAAAIATRAASSLRPATPTARAERRLPASTYSDPKVDLPIDSEDRHLLPQPEQPNTPAATEPGPVATSIRFPNLFLVPTSGDAPVLSNPRRPAAQQYRLPAPRPSTSAPDEAAPLGTSATQSEPPQVPSARTGRRRNARAVPRRSLAAEAPPDTTPSARTVGPPADAGDLLLCGSDSQGCAASLSRPAVSGPTKALSAGAAYIEELYW
jgi:hypothetical protein